MTTRTAVPARPGSTRSRLGRAVSMALALAALGLVGWQLRSVDPAAVASALRRLPAQALWLALAATLASYAVYASFDLLGRARQRAAPMLPSVARTLLIAYVAYAFSLSFGIAGLAARFRLYRRQGLRTGASARIWAVTLATNWLGFAILAGVLLLLEPATFGPVLPIGDGPRRAVGALLCLAPAVGWIWLAPGRRRLLAAQCALSALNWLLIAVVIDMLFGGRLPLALVMAALLASAAALAVVDVPGGLGVTEAVFLWVLGPHLDAGTLWSGLLLYRVVYFLLPLLLAAVLWPIADSPVRRARPLPPAVRARSPRALIPTAGDSAMNDSTPGSPTTPPSAPDNQGEGNVEAARRYDEAAKRFADSGRVEGAAEAAAPRNAEEDEAMRKAEEAGKSRAREEDPAVSRSGERG